MKDLVFQLEWIGEETLTLPIQGNAQKNNSTKCRKEMEDKKTTHKIIVTKFVASWDASIQ